MLTAAFYNVNVRDNLNALAFLRVLGQSRVTTAEASISATYGDLATVGPAVTLTTGTSALVIVSFFSDTVAANRDSFMTFAVTGATTRAASDNDAARVIGISTRMTERSTRVTLVTGLTAGSNIFTAKYRGNGTSVTFEQRDLFVLALPE